MSTVSPPRSVALLGSALTWTRDCLQLARISPLSAPTPCRDWDLGQLLAHMDDSLVTFGEAAALGHVAVGHRSTPSSPDQLVDRLVKHACRTHGAWLRRLTSAPVGVGDLALGRDTVALVGALEIAVHGWDVAVAAGGARPLPEELAAGLYEIALAVVGPGERGQRFAPAVPTPDSAPLGVRLLAHLGRAQPGPGERRL